MHFVRARAANRFPRAAIAVSLSVLVALTFGRAMAFELDVHERIVRESLGGQMGSSQLDAVVGSFVLGTGNRGSDQHQFAPERHFDSSPDTSTICDRQQQGLSSFLDDAVASSEPNSDTEGRELTDAVAALHSFGESTHAIADFYSHTNWAELAFEHHNSPAPAPILGTSCDPDAFPPDLQSGYFSLTHGPDGCPGSTDDPNPPAPFHFCHLTINKDAPTKDHGADRAPGGAHYHEVAVQLAEASTRAAWQELKRRIMVAYDGQPAAVVRDGQVLQGKVNGQCVFDKLAFGGDTPCIKALDPWHGTVTIERVTTSRKNESNVTGTNRHTEAVTGSETGTTVITLTPDGNVTGKTQYTSKVVLDIAESYEYICDDRVVVRSVHERTDFVGSALSTDAASLWLDVAKDGSYQISGSTAPATGAQTISVSSTSSPCGSSENGSTTEPNFVFWLSASDFAVTGHTDAATEPTSLSGSKVDKTTGDSGLAPYESTATIKWNFSR